MNFIPVISSNLAAVAYDQNTQVFQRTSKCTSGVNVRPFSW